MNSMVTINQKSIIDTQKIKKKELKFDTEENYQTKEQRLKEEETENHKNN